MVSLMSKLSSFARSPQGRRTIEQATRKAQQMAKDPANRAKVEDLRRNLGKRRR